MEAVAPVPPNVRIVTQCTSVEEFVTLFRPLCRGETLFVPTTAPRTIGTFLHASLSLSNGRPVIEGAATVVDPFASGLATGGYQGMALLFQSLSPASHEVLAALVTPTAGTIPFGVPSGADGDRFLCEIVELTPLPAHHSFGPPLAIPPAPQPPIGLMADADTSAVPTPIQDPASTMRETPAGPRGALFYTPDEATVPTARYPDFGFERQPGGKDGGRRLRPDSVTDIVSAPLPPPGPAGAPLLVGAESQEPSGSGQLRTVIVASLCAALLGVGVGYLLWEHGRSQRAPASAAKQAEPTEVDEAKGEVDETDDDQPESKEAIDESDQAKGKQRAGADTVQGKAPDSTSGTAPADEDRCTASLDSSPSGAAVFVNDRLAGPTPFSGSVECGEAVLAFRLPGYVNQDVDASLAQDSPYELAVDLKRPTHQLRVASVPRRAVVKVDGKRVGLTPVTVNVIGFEPVQIVLSKRGFRPQKQEVVTTEAKTAVNVRLQRR